MRYNHRISTWILGAIFVVAAIAAVILLCTLIPDSPPPTYCEHGHHEGQCHRSSIMMIPMLVGKVIMQQPHVIPCECIGNHQ